MTGTGSSLNVGTILYLGYAGTGTLSVGSGGTVTVGTAMYFGWNGGSGTFYLNTGGTLNVGGAGGIAAATAPAFYLAGGSLVVTGGNLSTSVPMALSNTTTINTNGLNATLSGNLTGTSVGLIKTGAGALLLSGSNSYTGTTTVSGGNLQVGSGGVGSLAGGNTVSINGSGAVLSGTGLVSGPTSVILGQINPGDSGGTLIGKLSFGSGLTFAPAATTTVATLKITGSTAGANLSSDQIQVSGILTLSSLGNITITDAGYTPAAGDSFRLLNWGSLVAGDFTAGSNRTGGLGSSDLNLPALATGFGWNVSSFLTNGVISVQTVPEPGRAGLFIFGWVGVLLRRRRNR